MTKMAEIKAISAEKQAEIFDKFLEACAKPSGTDSVISGKKRENIAEQL